MLENKFLNLKSLNLNLTDSTVWNSGETGDINTNVTFYRNFARLHLIRCIKSGHGFKKILFLWSEKVRICIEGQNNLSARLFALNSPIPHTVG